MKRYYYESIVAKVLLCLSDCSTIAIGPFVFSVVPETGIPQTVRNHETVHAVQWGEVTMIAGFIILCIQTLFGLSIWWILLASIIYYIWYAFEWLVKLMIVQDCRTAYRAVCFEQEAYDNQKDNDYIENRHMVTPWLKKVSVWRV